MPQQTTEDHLINLPRIESTDSADSVKSILDKYFTSSISFPTNQVDAGIGFFENRGFDKLVPKLSVLFLCNKQDLMMLMYLNF